EAGGRGATRAAPVHESEWTRNRRKVHCPIKRGIAAAGDDDAFAAQRLDLPHGVENGGALISLDAGDRWPFGLERAPAGCDHDDFDLEHPAAVGRDAEQRIADGLDAL